ncbi:DMT family transporter [Rhodobacteraceae bacterium W635]|uniref:DMT family transporter n=1 Tax=Nioella halotolerans TaxID=2303578 RepID=UPI000E3CFD4D|nr:DMT family transporter [Rhodobacteraceae bacterium W635]
MTAAGIIPETGQPGRAALWMIGAIVSFSAMAVAGRELASDLDTFEMMTYRSVIGVVIVVAAATVRGKLGEITTRQLGRHALRNIAHFAGQNLWLASLSLIPLAQVFALEFTSPLWVILLAPLLLGERFSARKLGVVVCGFAGILIIAQPGVTPVSLGTVTAAGAAVCFALTGILTKQLTRHASVTCILFYLTVMQLVFGLVCAGVDGDIALPTLATLPGIVVIGLGGLAAHYCITTAMTLAPATVVLPVDFARLPVIAMVGMLVYDEPIKMSVFLGALLIFGANYANVLAETRPRRGA